MNTLLYCLARLAIAALQALPLRVVARLSRAGGAVAWWLDARHRRVALNNLNLCFAAEKSPAEIRALADYNNALAELALNEGTTLERRHVNLEVK